MHVRKEISDSQVGTMNSNEEVRVQRGNNILSIGMNDAKIFTVYSRGVCGRVKFCGNNNTTKSCEHVPCGIHLRSSNCHYLHALRIQYLLVSGVQHILP